MSYMEIRNLKKVYNPYGMHPKVALNGLDFKVEKGDFICIMGAICGVIGSFFYEHSVPDASAMNGTLAILIPMACCMLGSLLMGILYCFLTVTLRANQNVTGLAMTTFGVGLVTSLAVR